MFDLSSDLRVFYRTVLLRSARRMHAPLWTLPHIHVRVVRITMLDFMNVCSSDFKTSPPLTYIFLVQRRLGR